MIRSQSNEIAHNSECTSGNVHENILLHKIQQKEDWEPLIWTNPLIL